MTPISEWEDNRILPEQEQNKLHETGHAKNVTSFWHLIAYCKNLGDVYNPSNSALKIDRLETSHQTAVMKIKEVEIQKTIFNSNINNRKQAFENLKPFATKIINAFAASGVNNATLEEAKAVNKKIQGVLLKKTDQPHSISQQS